MKILNSKAGAISDSGNPRYTTQALPKNRELFVREVAEDGLLSIERVVGRRAVVARRVEPRGVAGVKVAGYAARGWYVTKFRAQTL